MHRPPLIASVLALLPAAPAAGADNPWLAEHVLNIAHQGGENEFPSNTLYAFKRSVKAGADMLELDIGVTRDGKVVVSHDVTLERTTDGSGTIESRTLRQVMKAFPDTPINIEIKGRTKAEAGAEYVANAEVLAQLLCNTTRRDLIVVSFRLQAVDRFHELAPEIATVPGVDGKNAENVARAHGAGYAWHTWLSDDGESRSTWRQLIDWCVDGVMTARPVAFAKLLRTHPAPEACG